MDVVEIHNRTITLRLTPEDAFCLAWALRVAERKAADAITSSWLTTASSCFEAAALAAGAYSLCHPDEAVRLTLTALRAGRVLDPVSLAFDVAREELFPPDDLPVYAHAPVSATRERNVPLHTTAQHETAAAPDE